MKLDFSKYHLKDKYRELLEYLSDEDKIRISIKKYSIEELDDICEYYNLRQHPLIKTLGLKKYGKDPESACFYAKDVIKGRWKEAEEIIKTNPHYAYCYAIDVIKGRWKEAEEYIKTYPYSAYNYAYYVIEGRWPEAEEVIKTHPYSAYYYARFVIEGRWIEAEPFIKKDSNYASYYAEYIIGDKNFWDKQNET